MGYQEGNQNRLQKASLLLVRSKMVYFANLRMVTLAAMKKNTSEKANNKSASCLMYGSKSRGSIPGQRDEE